MEKEKVVIPEKENIKIKTKRLKIKLDCQHYAIGEVQAYFIPYFIFPFEFKSKNYGHIILTIDSRDIKNFYVAFIAYNKQLRHDKCHLISIKRKILPF